jgi:hypothetical protein
MTAEAKRICLSSGLFWSLDFLWVSNPGRYEHFKRSCSYATCYKYLMNARKVEEITNRSLFVVFLVQGTGYVELRPVYSKLNERNEGATQVKHCQLPTQDFSRHSLMGYVSTALFPY